MNLFLTSIGFLVVEAVDTDLIEIKEKYKVLLDLART
jgi:hypothetical protein